MEIPVYNLKIQGQERKAIDIEYLKNFINSKKFEFSLLNIDPNSLNSELKLMDHVGPVALSLLNEIIYTLDLHLGLVQPEPEVQESTPEPTPKQVQELKQTTPQQVTSEKKEQVTEQDDDYSDLNDEDELEPESSPKKVESISNMQKSKIDNVDDGEEHITI